MSKGSEPQEITCSGAITLPSLGALFDRLAKDATTAIQKDNNDGE